MQVLLIKTSSMGDIIHTLPALTDASIAIPGIKFDWVVEPAFQEIPVWHSAVQNIMVAPLRSWRKNLLANIRNGAITQFWQQLRAKKYDLVIDAQGLVKSAVLARLSRSKIYAGFSRDSAREALASFAYNKTALVATNLHAITRIRQLFAAALGYSLADKVLDYGVAWQTFQQISAVKPYLFFLHGTTWDTKHWPVEYWQQLAHIAGQHGYDVYMTWATAAQKSRVAALADQVAAIKMLPHLSLTEAAQYLRGAAGVVTVDTGFGHLAAALGKPMVSLYGPTDPNKVGMLGAQQFNLAAQIACAPCAKKVCANSAASTIFPPCFAALTPELVWNKLTQVLKNS